MSVRADMQQAAEDLVTQGGDASTYLPVVGDPVPDIYVLVFPRMVLQPGGFDSQVVEQEGLELQYAKADLAAVPKRGDVFRVEETDYVVQAPDADDGYLVSLIVKEVS